MHLPCVDYASHQHERQPVKPVIVLAWHLLPTG